MQQEQLGKETKQHGDGLNHRVFFGVGCKIIHDLHGPVHIPGPKGFLQFKDIVIFADTYVFLNQRGINACPFGDIDDELLKFICDAGQICTKVFCEQRCGWNIDGISAFPEIGCDPFRYLIFVKPGRFKQHTGLLELLRK